MEPQVTSPNPSPEMGGPYSPESGQKPAGPEASSTTPEQQPSSPEAQETAPTPGAGSGPVVALPQLPTLPIPQPAASTVQIPVKDQNPVSASDEDLIEKEWVDKAKRIVAQTKDDPYTQEKEVSKLQADYLKKRYGKEIKLSSDQ